MELKQINILIVDDEEAYYSSLGTLIDEGLNFDNPIYSVKQKAKITYAIKAEEALALVSQIKFDLILLDINLKDTDPIKDGFYVCSKLKADANYNSIPIIFITNSPRTETNTINKCYENGGQDYITKDSSDDEIIARIKCQIEIRLARAKIEKQNEDITDSIRYAKRIQTAILPPQRIVKQYLEHSFIFYEPKDIVAGDFYWMETINDLVIFAACDCTGHGVPGAMVSVVCHNALFRATHEFELKKPSEILDKVEEIVTEYFKNSDDRIMDGMDISLCSYNNGAKILEWAGANNPLWIIRNSELIETKANKQPIGINDMNQPFTNHTFQLFDGDCIYLFTDGFADQFGGSNEKKFMTKKFKETLIRNSSLPMADQGIELEKVFNDWKGKEEQVDDVLVIGVRI